MKTIDVGIIGAGLVGKAFIDQLASHRARDLKFNVVFISRSKTALISGTRGGIDLQSWERELQSSISGALQPEEALKVLKEAHNPAVLVDNTSDDSWAKAYPKLIAAGISIVTPNKKAFSGDIGLWSSILESQVSGSSPAFVYHEATVGAGLPVIGTLKDLIVTGDNIEKIEGILSGTLSYIFNNFSPADLHDASQAPKFSAVVKTAKEQGFTEPDPRDDLNGLDMARKFTIMGRIAGANISTSSLRIQSLIPTQLESVASGDEFLQKLPNFDDDMQKMLESAIRKNKVLRYVGEVDLTQSTPRAFVGIKEYGRDHPFASLKGSGNVVSFRSARYQDPMIIQGTGAGADVTAAGVLADLVKVSEKLGRNK